MYSDIYERQDNGDLALVGNLTGDTKTALADFRRRWPNTYGQLVALPMLDHRDTAL